MDLPLALALAARANAFFRGASGRMEVLAGHPAFARFNDLVFVRQTGLGGDIVAEGSVPWFRRLRNEGVAHVRPSLSGLQVDKALDKAWGLITEGDRGLELWSATVGRRFQGHDDLQPFRATMTSSRYDRWSLKAPLSVEEAGVALLQALRTVKLGLEEAGQVPASGAVGKFIGLHETEYPDVSGDLASVAPDLAPEALPLFASSARAYALIEKTEWLASSDETLRTLAEILWDATRDALETSVSEICATTSDELEPIVTR